MGNRTSFPITQIPKQRTFIVTGSNTGIGYEVAKWCAMMGGTVILACRSEERTRKAMDRMQKDFAAEQAKGTKGLTDSPTLALEFMKLDLSSFESVVNFCNEFKKRSRQLHVLVCNAGVGFAPYKQSGDGLELMLQVNYLSHFLMIAKLLPVMKQSGPDCRIILTASSVHNRGTFDIATMNYTGTANKFPLWDYYGRSKLYQIMQSYAMARRLKGSNITINSLHPGFIDTDLFREADKGFSKCIFGCFRCCGIMKTTIKGASTSIDLATNPKRAEMSGHYWVDCKIKTSSSTSRDEQKQEALWKATFPFIEKYLTESEKAGMESDV